MDQALAMSRVESVGTILLHPNVLGSKLVKCLFESFRRRLGFDGKHRRRHDLADLHLVVFQMERLQLVGAELALPTTRVEVRFAVVTVHQSITTRPSTRPRAITIRMMSLVPSPIDMRGASR